MLGMVSCTTSPKQEPPPGPSLKIESKPKKIPSTHVSTGKYSSIGLEELFLLQQSGEALIYDVRGSYFYGIDHIPGAINWPHTDYVAQVQARDLEIQKALKDGKKIVIYCFNFGCPEARGVARKLVRRDYPISVFGSGMDAWRTAGLPLE
jgi:rhodanese-related sulfurtransferase